jgi:hypothetical protein
VRRTTQCLAMTPKTGRPRSDVIAIRAEVREPIVQTEPRGKSEVYEPMHARRFGLWSRYGPQETRSSPNFSWEREDLWTSCIEQMLRWAFFTRTDEVRHADQEQLLQCTQGAHPLSDFGLKEPTLRER